MVRECPYSEAQLLSIYFEEQALKAAEDRKEAMRHSSNSPSADFRTDDVFGDGDEIDYFEAKRQGLVQ